VCRPVYHRLSTTQVSSIFVYGRHDPKLVKFVSVVTKKMMVSAKSLVSGSELSDSVVRMYKFTSSSRASSLSAELISKKRLIGLCSDSPVC